MSKVMWKETEEEVKREKKLPAVGKFIVFFIFGN
jgi:hypothetical protein